MRRHVLASCLVVLVACGQAAEVRIDETKGIPAVRGSTDVQLGTFTCGMPITSGDVTVTTTVVTGGCEFSFTRDLPVVRAEDYTNIPDLKGATSLVQRIELSVNRLAFTDGAMPLDLATRVTSATLQVNGQTVAEKASLTSLPRVVTLSGAALDQLKARIDARQPASVATKVVVVLPSMPPPPQRLVIDYDAQPAIILGVKAPTIF